MIPRSVLLALAVAVACARAEDPHWAYQPPVAADIPADVHPVDHLLARERAAAGIRVAKLADPDQWLERAAFTLTGLPPDEESRRRLVSQPTEETWRELLDDLLANPAYGERWARHWMDVARYADTRGYNFGKDNRYPHAYTYRDWLIDAFNRDLPYDQFVRLQVAADLLVPEDGHPDLAALGFLTVGPRLGGIETTDDRVDVITRGFLSSTISCARCHDHKTDPFTQSDYYSLYAIVQHTNEDNPVIGTPPDESAAADFRKKEGKLLAENHRIRQALVEELRSADTIAKSLEVAWLARTHRWSDAKLETEAFKRGLKRFKAVRQWTRFLERRAWGADPSPRLARWVTEIETAVNPSVPCRALATEWSQALGTNRELGRLARDRACPLSHDVNRINAFFHQTDGQDQRERDGALGRLRASHPGAPPRAMALRDRPNRPVAHIFRRGNPNDRGEAFAPHWPETWGGGPFPDDRSARLELAERIAHRSNPLTARVIVNRVWNWHFGTPLANPGDFGPQEPAPTQQVLLDWLALWLMDHDWSIKDLHRLLLTSEAFRLAADGPEANRELDEANTRFWKWNRRRLDFEAMRDHLLATAGTLETGKVGGRPVDLLSRAADRRRSLYGFIDRESLPGLLVNFDVPHPDVHAPERTKTIVPQQALYFLNNELPVRLAAHLAKEAASEPDPAKRVHWIYERLLRRTPTDREASEALDWIRDTPPGTLAPPLSGHWEVRYRARDAPPSAPLEPFPLLQKGAWKTGPDLATAPVPYLHAAPDGGHASATHDLVLRWRAHGNGEVRMAGSLRRAQKGGATLQWSVIDAAGKSRKREPLPPESSSPVGSGWIRVQAGDTVDFVLSAPDGAHCAQVHWSLKMLGRDAPGDQPRELGILREQFPTTNEPPPFPPSGDPWADLIQVLWACNEFHFID